LIEANIGDITSPYLIGMRDFHLLDQVRIAWIGMIAICGPFF
jgi:hypothetical protein